jgi:hypothetical protein
MKDFLEKNKVPLTIIAAAFIIAGAIWLSKRPAAREVNPRPDGIAYGASHGVNLCNPG